MIVEYEGFIINLQYMPLPPDTHDSVTVNTDDSFTLFLDPNDSPEKQMEGFLHGVEKHIKGDHLYNTEDKNADELEVEAHDLKKEEPKKQRQKITWKYSTYDLYMLKKHACLRDYYGIELDDLPEEALWPPKYFQRGRDIPKEYKQQMTDLQLSVIYQEYGMYDRLEELQDKEMAVMYKEIIEAYEGKTA